MNLEQKIKAKALRLGFAACGIAEVAPAESEAIYFDTWLANGMHAGMTFMENYRNVRKGNSP